MNNLEAYTLGYACRFVEQALSDQTKTIDLARCALQPIKYLYQLQDLFLHQQTPDRGVVRFLYAMHRNFHFDTLYEENAMLDEQLQWIWLMGYCMLDVDDYKQNIYTMLC